MWRVLLSVAAVLASASCIVDQDVQVALSAYCTGASGQQTCSQTDMPTGCCPGYVCTGTCVLLLDGGQCLGDGVVGHGTQIANSPCGCDADCAVSFHRCLDFACRKP